jgi:predicted negative regulator of RcsB-dependent stress response
VDSTQRHKLKSDKFSETVVSGTHWAVDHRGKLIGAGVIIVVVVLAVFGFSYQQSNREREANDQLAKAFITIESPIRKANEPVVDGEESYASESDRATAANKTFNAVASAYPQTDAGHNALYMSGVTAAEIKDNAKAEAQLKQASEHGNKDIASLAKLALANLYYATNRTNEAIALLQDLQAHPTTSVPSALAGLQLGSIYEKTDPEKAKAIYGDLQKNEKNEEAKKIVLDRMTKKSGASSSLQVPQGDF